jgi:hypothetical protein
MKRGSIDWSKYDKYLGVWTDNKLAKEIGCSTKTIHYRRSKFGIPPNAEGLRQRKHIGSDKITWKLFDNLLGTMPDPDVAEIINCEPRSVCKRRNKLGIPSFNPPTRKTGGQ